MIFARGGGGIQNSREGTLPPPLRCWQKTNVLHTKTYRFCLPLQIFRPSYDPDNNGYTALVKRIRKNTLWNAKCFFMLHYFKSYYTFYSLWHVSNLKNIALSLNKLWPTLISVGLNLKVHILSNSNLHFKFCTYCCSPLLCQLGGFKPSSIVNLTPPNVDNSVRYQTISRIGLDLWTFNNSNNKKWRRVTNWDKIALYWQHHVVVSIEGTITHSV